MATEINDIKGYRWETGYEKSWEEIKEGEDGLGIAAFSDSLALLERRRKRQQNGVVVRLGMMRHLNVILDCSEAMLDQDLKPTRQMCTLKLLQKFIKEFVEQNPISQLGLIVTRNRRAEKISDLSGNTRKHLQNLEPCSSVSYCVGEPSLQNALELALLSMKMLPSHTSREILVIFGSLATCDPANISDTADSLKSHDVKVSVIGLCAEVHVLRTLCNLTGGQYHIVLDDNHYQELLLNYVSPRSVSKDSEATCVKMGFPHHSERILPFTGCMCHLGENIMNKTGYFCPQCNSKYCELPVECKTCGITLVTSAHLVRPLHHLIPVHIFKDIENSPSDSDSLCYGCQKRVKGASEQMTICNDCKQVYCIDCDLYIHNSLHMCPGCAVLRNNSISWRT